MHSYADNYKELTDERWLFIKPLLPMQPAVGRKRADDRKTINGILYMLVTGCIGLLPGIPAAGRISHYLEETVNFETTST
ncbi:transposase [Methanothrix thermoacetophila]|uniref:transposase n=1 Tax=Methanothrix thermoacetophila TaxID=2224 RepID=UPI00373AE205